MAAAGGGADSAACGAGAGAPLGAAAGEVAAVASALPPLSAENLASIACVRRGQGSSEGSKKSRKEAIMQKDAG